MRYKNLATPRILSSAVFTCSAFLFITTCFNNSALAQTYDLLDVYQATQKNDPQWAQEEEGYFAKAESKNIARAGLLPQVQAGITQSNNRYTGTSASFSLDADKLASCQLNASDSVNIGTAITALNCLAAPEESSSSFSSTSYNVSIVQPIVRLDRWYQYKGSEAISEQAKKERERALQDLILRTSEAYFNVLRANQAYLYASQQEENTQAQLNGVQRRYEKGLLNSSDVYQIQALHDISYAYKITAENMLSNAVNMLEKMTQIPGIQIAALPDDLPIELPRPSTAQEWVNIAKQNSPELKIATLGIAAANHNHQSKKSLHAPTVDFFASYNQTESDGSTATLNQGSTNYTSAGVNLNVPIFTGGYNYATAKQAKHQMKQAEFIKENVYQDVITNTQILFRNVVNTVTQVKAQQSAVMSNQRAYQSIVRGYEQGIKNASDLAVSQKDLYSAQKDFSNAKYDFILDALKLKRVTGILSEDDLKLINQRLNQSDQNANKEEFDPNHYPVKNEFSREKEPKKSLVEVIRGWF